MKTTKTTKTTKTAKPRRRIMYLRDDNYQPVGCLAISVSKNQKQVRYQLSVVNPVDKFERSLARHIALGRLLEMPFRVEGFDGSQNGWEVTTAVMRHILQTDAVPTRAKKAAKRWLSYNS